MLTQKTGASLDLKVIIIESPFCGKEFLFILFRIHYRYFANDTKEERITSQLIYLFDKIKKKETFSFLKQTKVSVQTPDTCL